MADIQAEITGLLDKMRAYFLQLNDYEKYAWGGEGLGFLLIIAGIVLLF